MKQFTFTSQLAPIIWKYLESRQNEGYTSVHCGYYMQELDCLSKELSDAPVVTKELIDAWDLLKPYLSNRSKIVRHNAIRAFAKFAYTQDGISYVPDTSKLKNSSTFTPHIFTVEEIRRLLYAADNLPVRNNAPTRHLVIPAVIRLLYCCGFRIGEVLRLRVKDVDLDTGIITVHNGKGGKDRLVPVHNSVIEYLRSYSAQLPDEREWFFPSACGHYSIKTIFNEPLSLRVKQSVITAVGVFVDFTVAHAFKASGTGQSLAETADAGEHIYKSNHRFDNEKRGNQCWLPLLVKYVIFSIVHPPPFRCHLVRRSRHQRFPPQLARSQFFRSPFPLHLILFQ